MRRFTLFLFLTLSWLSSFADSYLSTDDLTMKPGETKAVTVSLHNSVDVCAYQCDILLPAGFSFATTTNGSGAAVYATATSRKETSHSIMSSIQKNGALRIVEFSSANAVFAGTEGAVATFYVKADEHAALGGYSLQLSKVELSTPSLTPLHPDDRSSNITVYDEYTISIEKTTVGGSVSGGGTCTSGQSITLAATPNEGYHFVSWSNGSSANPLTFQPSASATIKATFAPNKYGVNYSVGGTIVHTDSIAYGSAVTAWTAPTKEGYTFSGWSEIPTTMPAKDVVVIGSFTVNTYKATFEIDGVQFSTIEVAYGSEIKTPEVPEKEGYTFSGWKNVPTTMPAKDLTISGNYVVGGYNMTYMVDGKEYKKFVINYGTTITPETVPTKEGYTFSGWSDIPTTMPAKDVVITGTFAVNTYKVNYSIDGTVVHTDAVAYGTAITAWAAPAKEGYTFSGWSSIPSTMPASDVTITGSYTVNKYTLTYKVDGADYKTLSLDYGSTVTPETVPTKEGYTFSGWSEIPTTMPAKDVVVTGSFTVNTYKATFEIDGVQFSTIEVAYGSEIKTPEVPEKEGYTFSGWKNVPTTMPAKDLTISGNYVVGGYNMTYMVDGKEYKKFVINYGTTITPETVPTKEGYTFSGWSDIPTTMPAKDVVITGTFAVNTYKVNYSIDGTVVHTDAVAYGTAITAWAAPAKEGYTFSGWSSIPSTMPASDLTITGSYTVNKYTLTYNVDVADYKTLSVDYGSTITPETVPTKAGYTFSGWS